MEYILLLIHQQHNSPAHSSIIIQLENFDIFSSFLQITEPPSSFKDYLNSHQEILNFKGERERETKKNKEEKKNKTKRKKKTIKTNKFLF